MERYYLRFIVFLCLKPLLKPLVSHSLLCVNRALPEITVADFVTDFAADCVTDFCILLSFKLVGKSFGVTQAKTRFTQKDCKRLQAKDRVRQVKNMES